ncbi:uncharacterized protein LOC131947149 [Physella acuta]|uniref:uncharacterized protein LOC131947149 n=1 Tax=Physella acuta TaxID=109671 RepID=UPI0027DD0653|nr:uncharacterized protein LOC131947149 [Physella acuta]
MESLVSALMLITLALSSLVVAGSPTGTGVVSARDTDKASALRNKLQKLRELLSQDVDEVELKSYTAQKPASDKVDLKSYTDQKPAPTKTPAQEVSEDDMKHALTASDVVPVKSFKNMSTYILTYLHYFNLLFCVQGTRASIPLSKSDEDSIDVLSKALARLHQPKYKSRMDSIGEYLGTEYNEEEEPGQDVVELENLIRRALVKLSEEKTAHPKPALFKLPSTENIRQIEQPQHTEENQLNAEVLKDNKQLKAEALKAVENQLLRDISLLNKLGFTVDDVISDLQNKENRDDELKKIEEELDRLANS